MESNPHVLELPGGFLNDERKLLVIFNGKILTASGHFEDEKGDFEICGRTLRFFFPYRKHNVLQIITLLQGPHYRLVYRSGHDGWEHMDDTSVW